MTKAIKTTNLFTSFNLRGDQLKIDLFEDIQKSELHSRGKDQIISSDDKETYVFQTYLHNNCLFTTYYKEYYDVSEDAEPFFREVRDAETNALRVLAHTSNDGNMYGEYTEFHPDGKTIKIKTTVETSIGSTTQYCIKDYYEECFSNGMLKVEGEIYDTGSICYQPLIGLVIEGDELGNQQQCLYSYAAYPSGFDNRKKDNRVRVVVTDIKEEFVKSLNDIYLAQKDEGIEARCAKNQPTTLYVG